MSQAFHHVAISTPDLQRALRFYRDLLGLEVLNETSWPRGTLQINQVLGLSDSAATTVMLQGRNLCIELFQFDEPAQPPRDVEQGERPVHRHGITHFCIDVKDIHSLYQRLLDAGTCFHAPPQDFGGVRATYGRDPDGNVFELQEILDA
ncbi:lactoylglutathione lyase family protein [compost metagenome]